MYACSAKAKADIHILEFFLLQDWKVQRLNYRHIEVWPESGES
jgi:hypothetical protein